MLFVSTLFLQAGVTALFAKIGGAIAAAVVAVAAGISISKLGHSVMEATARQPEAAGDIRTTAIIIGALIEGVCFFAVVVCLLSIF